MVSKTKAEEGMRVFSDIAPKITGSQEENGWGYEAGSSSKTLGGPAGLTSSDGKSG